MNSALARSMFALAWPAGIPLLAAVVYAQLWATPGAAAGLWASLPYAAGGVAIALGWRFNRSRAVFAAATVLLAGEALTLGADAWVALLLPLNLVLFALLTDRGTFSTGGLLRWGLLAIQVQLVRTTPKSPAWLADPLVALSLPTSLAQPALVAFAMAALVILGRFARRRGALESGLLGALVAMFFALHAGPDTLARHLYWSAAGIVLALAVVETGHTLAFRDELTGLPSRRALQESLARLGGRYTLAMVDVDHFKKFNDKHGHDAGDDVLRLVAAKLARVGGGGRAYRYGGEEFTVVFSGDDVEAARPHLEALREGIADARFTVRATIRPARKPARPKKPARSKQLSVKVSIGAAERRGRETPEAVLKRADKQLYAAKKAGRNRLHTA